MAEPPPEYGVPRRWLMMRRRSVIVWGLAVILLVGLSPLAAAVSDVSFRMIGMGKGLAGIVDDEYTDFNLFPAVVVDTTGTTLFTNLGNLGSTPQYTLRQDYYGEADRYYDRNEATNMAGVVTDLGAGRGGFLVEYGSSDSSTEVPVTTTTGSGILMEFWDGEIEDKAELTDASVFYGQTLDNGVKVGGRLGMASSEDTLSSQTMKRTTVNNVSGSTVDSVSTIRKHIDDQHSGARLEAGAQFQAGDYAVDIAGKYAPDRLRLSDLNLDAGFEDYHNSVTESFSPEWRPISLDLGRVALDSTAVSARASRSATLFGKDAVLRFFGGYSHGSGDYQETFDSYTTERVTSVTSQGVTATHTTVEELNNLVTGDVTQDAGEVGVGYQVDLGEGTILGLGLRASGTKNRATLTNEESSHVKTVDGKVVDDVEEPISPVKWTLDSRTWAVSLPVGLEHQVNDRLAVRLGAEALFVNHVSQDWERETTNSPKTATVAADGGSEETVSYSGSQEDSETYAVYSAGFGYKLSDNIQLDMVHVNNLVNIQNWLVSATIKF